MKRFFSIILSLILVAGTMPASAFADSIKDLNVIEKPAGGKEIKPQSLKVTIRNGDQEVGEGGTIDQGKDMKVSVQFMLTDIPIGEDGEPDFSDSKATNQGDYMMIDLPKEMNFAQAETKKMPMSAAGRDDLVMGELTIENSRGTLVFGEDAANPDYLKRGGQWEASIKINWEEVTEEGKDLVFTIFGKDCTVVVKPEANPDRIDISKSGKADISKGKITWTVQTTPSKAELNYDNYTFTDQLPNTVSYIEGTFTIEGHDSSKDPFSYDTGTNAISYQFPEGVTGVQKISYDTKIKNLVKNNGKTIVSKNQATITNGEATATTSASVSVTPKWIEKTGSYQVKDHSVDWTVTVNESGASLKNVVVTDQLAKGLTLIHKAASSSDANRWPLVAMQGYAGLIYPLEHKVEGKPYYTLSDGNEMKIYLGDIKGKATIKFSTKLDNTVQSSVKNTAHVNWNDEGSDIVGGGEGEGAGATGSAEPGISQGFITKEHGSYDFTANVMPWTIKVNSAKQSISTSRIVEIFAYNKNGITATKSIEMAKLPEAYQAHTVNTNQRYIDDSLSSATVQVSKIGNGDAFTAKGQYKVHTVDLGSNQEAQILEIYTGELSSSPEVVQLNTTLTDINAYGVNGRNSAYDVNNTAFLHTANSGEETIVSATSKAEIKRHIIEKNLEKGYDYKDRTATWRVYFNHNGLKISDGVITDTMPAGWIADGNVENWEFFELYEGKRVPVTGANPEFGKERRITGEELKQVIDTVSITTNKNGCSVIEFKLKEIQKPYILLIKSKLTEEGANQLFSKNETVAVRNTASMKGSSIVGNPSDYEDIGITNNLASKRGELLADSPGEVKWTVDVNQNGITLPTKDGVDEVYVVDRLKNYLAPKKIGEDYAVSIWKMNRLANGTMAQGDMLDATGVQELVRYDKDSNTMMVKLPTIADAYRIDIITLITDDDVKEVTNAVELAGVKTTITSSSQGKPTIALTANAWGTKAGKITIGKTDGNGKGLAGAVFKLYEISMMNDHPVKNDTHKYVKSTNAAGILEFKYLKAGSYWVEEVTPPVGYVMGKDAAQLVTLTSDQDAVVSVRTDFVNHPLTGALQLQKIDQNGNDLGGAEFTLYKGHISPNTAVGSKLSESNGSVTFPDIKTGTYFIKETKAPEGYKLSDTAVVKAVVDVKGNVTYSVGGAVGSSEIPKIANEAYLADIAVLKQDKANKNLLGGAKFALYKENGEVLQEAVSDATDGIAWFKDIPYGKYTLKEIKAPAGYDLNNAALDITEKHFKKGEDGTRLLVTFVDQKTETGKPEPGEPEPGEPGPGKPEPGEPGPGEPGPGEPGGGSTGGGSGGGGGGGHYDPPTVDIQDPETPLAEGVEMPIKSEVPVILPKAPVQDLIEIGDDGNPLGNKDLRDPQGVQLPKTGGFAPEILWALGGVLTALGAGLRKKR